MTALQINISFFLLDKIKIDPNGEIYLYKSPGKFPLGEGAKSPEKPYLTLLRISFPVAYPSSGANTLLQVYILLVSENIHSI